MFMRTLGKITYWNDEKGPDDFTVKSPPKIASELLHPYALTPLRC